MTSHSHIQQQLAVYLHLSGAQRRAVDAHLQTCPTCAHTLAAYEQMDHLLATLPAPTPKAALRPTFYAALAQQHPARSSDGLLNILFQLPAAAVRLALLLLVLLLGWSVWQGIGEGNTAVPPTLPTPSPIPSPTPDDGSHAGVTVSLGEVSYTTDQTIIDLIVRTDGRWLPDTVSIIPPGIMARDPLLVDEQGREYPGIGTESGELTIDPLTGDALFTPRLRFAAPDPAARQMDLEFNLEFLNLPIDQPLTIPLANRQPGDTWAQPGAFALAGQPVNAHYTLHPPSNLAGDSPRLQMRFETEAWQAMRLQCLLFSTSSAPANLQSECADNGGAITAYYPLNGLTADSLTLLAAGSLLLTERWRLAWPVTAPPPAIAPTPAPPIPAIPAASLPQTQTAAGITVTLHDVWYSETATTVVLEVESHALLESARLFDDDARPYFQQALSNPTNTADGLVRWEISFDPVRVTAQQLTIQLNLREGQRAAGQMLTIPLDGRQLGEEWPMNETIMLGNLPVTISQARLAPPQEAISGLFTAFPVLELTADIVAQDGERLGCLFLLPEIDAVGQFGGCRGDSHQVIAYYELRDDPPQQPLTLAVRADVSLEGLWSFTWPLPGQMAIPPLPPPTAVTPQTMTPVFQAATLQINPFYFPDRQWSPDGQWVGFWGAAVIGEPENIHFLNTQTAQICPFPYEINAGNLAAASITVASHAIGWLADGDALIYERLGLRGWRGTPCAGAWQPVTDVSDIYTVPTPSFSPFSPDGRYLAETAVTLDPQGVIMVTLSLQDRRTGEPVNTISWQHYGNAESVQVNLTQLMENPELGGQWLGGETFLVTTTWDQGPLLLTGAGEVLNLVRDLFQAPQLIAQQGEYWLTATAVSNPAGGYNFLLTSWGNQSDTPPPLLYHSDSGIVEQLPPFSTGELQFSTDGRWLVYYPLPIPGSEGPWLRSVSPPGNDNYYTLPHLPATTPRFAPQWDRLALADSAGQITILTLPEGTPLATWTTPDYLLAERPLWSPDGRMLLVVGQQRGSDQAALFLIPVSPVIGDR